MLKAAAAVAGFILFLAVSRPAQAGTLLTGAIRDREGVAIAGARVTAFDAFGRTVGQDVALADGTFAVDAQTVPTAIAIACDYCEPVRQRVDPGEPVVVIVERFTAVTAPGPSAADIRALPYRSGSDIAALLPFTVVDTGRIVDRALDHEGAVTVNGLPFYSPADGSNFSQLVPAHSIAELTAASPLAAPLYGGYAAAGTYDLRLRDADLSTSRLDTGDASDVVLRGDAANGGAGYAASADPGDDRQAASADANVPFDGGRLSFDALGMSGSIAHASGAGLAYTTDSRRYTTAASFSATQTDASSLIAVSAQVRNHGPLELEYGARATRATGTASGIAGAQFDAAVYAAATRQTGISSLAATIAWDRGSDSGLTGGSQSAALVASLTDDLRLGSRWTAHFGTVSNLRIPTFAEVAAAEQIVPAGDRSLLFEQSLTYTDLRRLRVTALSYTQRATGSAAGHVNGIGADAAWQIAPDLALRTWVLRANQTATTVTGYPITPYPMDTTTAASLTRQLIWLTYEKYFRFDALIRGGALEGDVRIPINASYAFAIGTAEYSGRRVTTFGVTRR